MKRFMRNAACTIVLATAGLAIAQPTITSLGTAGGGTKPVNVTNSLGGTIYIGGGSGYWTLTGTTLTFVGNGGTGGGGKLSEDAAFQTGTQLNDGISGGGIARIFGNTAMGVSPAFRPDPTLTPSTTQPAANEVVGRRYNRAAGTWQGLGGLPVTGSLHVFGSSSSGGSGGAFLNPLAISSDGRFIGGQGYSCQYNNSSGTTITDNTFRWRPWIWDAQANMGAGAMRVLSTPFNTGSNTWRRRDGIVYGISTDGTVICGAQNHNVSVGVAADPDGSRPVVWRWNPGTMQYDFSFLPGGDNGAGLFYTVGLPFGSMHMNNAGTIIVARSVDTSGNGFIAKWVWNSGTNSWDAPINLGIGLATAPSWLPSEITACGAGTVVPTYGVTGMSEDGNTVFGYSEWKCGSGFPMRGGFIWHANDGVTRDWYEYLNGLGVAGVEPGGPWGPFGENGDNTKHQPIVGYPVDISPDGTTFTGFHSSNQMIPGAQPWVLRIPGDTTCVPPVVTLNPEPLVNFSRCSFTGNSTSVILNASALGTLPLSYQWYKNGQPVSDGPTIGGSSISGATTFQFRINNPVPSDSGSYHCVITGCNSNTVSTSASTVQVAAEAVTPGNDTCAGRAVVGEGTFTFNACGTFQTEAVPSCTTGEWGDVFFEYVPTFTGDARFQTCPSLVADTTIQLYSACGGSELDCNDNVGNRGLAGPGGCTGNKAVISRYPVTAGVPIIVRVGLRGSFPFLSTPATQAGTSGALIISQAPAVPANDACANATVVTEGTHPFNLLEATDDFDFGTDTCSTPVDTVNTSNRDVWFRFTSQCGGVYSFTTCGLASPNMTNPMLHIMFEDCLGAVHVCDDNTSGCTVGGSQQAQITGYPMNPGDTVAIRISQSGANSPGTNALSGTGQLNIFGTTNCGACCNGSNCSATSAAGCTGSFQGVGSTCGTPGNPTTCCPANFNGVGGVTVQDIFDFLNDYFLSLPSADFNGMGGVTVQDIFDFLAAYFTGCN